MCLDCRITFFALARDFVSEFASTQHGISFGVGRKSEQAPMGNPSSDGGQRPERLHLMREQNHPRVPKLPKT
jgi:hypothetical protein